MKWIAYIGIFVMDEYRRLGIGTNLVKNLLKVLKKDYDYIAVSPHDEKGYLFYKGQSINSWRGHEISPFDTKDFKQGLIKLKELYGN